MLADAKEKMSGSEKKVNRNANISSIKDIVRSLRVRIVTELTKAPNFAQR